MVVTTPAQPAFDGSVSAPTATPAALQWSTENCTIQRTLEVIGERWTLIVLREVFQGIRRFDDMTVRTAIPRQVLTDRLRRLVEAGLLRREPYREPGQRGRHEYRLTDKGLALYPVLIALQEWGDAYLGDPEGPPIEFAHRDCGASIGLVMRCAEDHDVTDNRSVVGRLGPGARRRADAGAASATSPAAADQQLTTTLNQ